MRVAPADPKWINSMKNFLIITFFLLGSQGGSWPVAAQHLARLLADPVAVENLNKGLPLMYNSNFAQAQQYFAPVQKAYPQHPVTPLLSALVIMWQNAPFHDYQGAAFKQHVQLLEQAIALSEKILAKEEDHVEAVFFKMVASGLMVLHYNDMGESMKAASEAKRLYTLINRSFELRKQNVELYFMTGLYNYYREYYPQVHPVYRPVAFFFRTGSRAEGLANLELCTQKAAFSAPDAQAYLANIYLRYEKNHAKALQHARSLVTKYPQNEVFITNLAETLLLTRHYTEASPYLGQLQASAQPFRQAVGKALAGVAAEWHEKQPEKALLYYQQAEVRFKNMGRYADPYRVYVYAGLYRYHQAKGQIAQAKQYHKLAKQYDANGYLTEEF
jgi:tetratricopeptide (TPR) repeat protein